MKLFFTSVIAALIGVVGASVLIVFVEVPQWPAWLVLFPLALGGASLLLWFVRRKSWESLWARSIKAVGFMQSAISLGFLVLLALAIVAYVFFLARVF